MKSRTKPKVIVATPRIRPVAPEVASVAVPTLVRAIAARVIVAERHARRAAHARDSHRAASHRHAARVKLREVRGLEVVMRRIGVDVRGAEGRLGKRIDRLEGELATRRRAA